MLRGASSGLDCEPAVEQWLRDGWTIESYRSYVYCGQESVGTGRAGARYAK